MRSHRRARARRLALLACLSSAWALAGCEQGLDDAVTCYLPRPRDLRRLNQVVMVELAYDGECPDLSRNMTLALVTALHERDLFHVAVIRREDPMLQDLPFDIDGRKTLKDLSVLRRTLKSDAVLIGRIRHFEPYPRMQVALCLQLLDLKQGRLVWGLEHTWDTGEKATERRIRDFFRKRMRGDYGPLDWRLATVSPTAFHKYVAHEVVGTLKTDPPEAASAPKQGRAKAQRL